MASKTKKQTKSISGMHMSPAMMLVFAAIFAAIGYVVNSMTNAAPANQTSQYTGTLSGPVGDVKLGGEVVWSATWNTRVKNPLVYTQCFQNGALVYGALMGGSVNLDVRSGKGEIKEQLGGGSSQWRTNGGAAECDAQLYYYSKSDIYKISPKVYFTAQGS